MNKVELLAPAGSLAALKAAVLSGADAVYLGGRGFGARAFAKNFDDLEIVEAIKFAHLYGVKVYVTLNTIIYDEEMSDVIEYVKFLYHNDVDAIIVQDLGLMSVVKHNFPELEIHASTQMTIHNTEALKFLKDIGIDRVVVARENTIEQIKRMVNEVEIDIEAFVHGAICVCFSGQCYMSGLIGGRSGNRGKCAQPCRKKYHLMVNEENKISKKFLLSPKDLKTIENIDQLIDSGIKSLKIEGRMKSPEYVAIVVSSYRRAIDYYYEHKKVNVSLDDQHEIAQIFNRQFTQGFLFNAKGNDFINLDKNNNTGVFIGKVISCDNKKLKILLSKTLNINDGIYFDKTETGLTVSKIIVNGKLVKSANVNEIVTLDVPNKIALNTLVYKTTDILLEEKARKIAENIQIIPISIEVELFINQNPRIIITDNFGYQVIETIDFLIEPSISQALDNQKITEQLSKLGNTPFILKNIKINRDEQIFITMGALNNLRRLAIDKLIALRQIGYNRSKLNVTYQYIESTPSISKVENLNLSVYVRTKEQLEACRKLGVKRIYVDEELRLKDNVADLYLVKGKIEYNVNIDKRYKGVVISNLGALNLLKANNNQEVVTNYNLNVVNSESVKFLLDNKVDLVTLSYELSASSYKNLLYKDKTKLEVIIYGYQEAMITKHCIYASNCKKQCKSNLHKIVDEKNEGFGFYTDDLCQMHILNSKRLCLLDEVSQLKEFGYSNFRLQFTIEDYQETLDVIKAYQSFLLENKSDKLKALYDMLKENKDYTRGFYNKALL